MNTLYQELLGSFIFLSAVYIIVTSIIGLEKSSNKIYLLIYSGIVCYQIFKITKTQELNPAAIEIAGFTLSTLFFLAILRKIKNKK